MTKHLPLSVRLAFGAAAALLALPAAAETPRDLPALMAAFARVPAARATYVERKQIALLDVPLRYEGRLTYRAPDYLKKEVVVPRAESYEISNGRLAIESDGQRRELALNEHPPLLAFIESLRATLAGDLASLTRNYEVAYEPGTRGWNLRLTPRAQLRSYITGITVHGSDAAIETVEIREASGDTSRMTIKPAP
jgi:hypothetical protein